MTPITPIVPKVISRKDGDALPPITDTEFRLIRDFLFERCGIDLKPEKKTLVRNRLIKRLRELKLPSYFEYFQYLVAHRPEQQHFLDAMTTNETFFFREENHWDYLRQTILPDVIRTRKALSRNFSIWSAASATGEELYTAAIVLYETLPEPHEWHLKLLGTDVNREVILAARKGVYGKYAVRHVKKYLMHKYFDEDPGNKGERWTIMDHIRKRCAFNQHNLQHVAIHRGFDLVLCRNVFIYFSAEVKQKVLANLVATLAVGGHIIFSHTEAMIPKTEGLKQVKPSIFQRIK